MCELFCKNKNNKECKSNTDILGINNSYNTSDVSNIANYYEKLHYKTTKNKKRCVLIQLTDTELKVTIEKIQELYRELGFCVKVIDVMKKKYTTEYEVAFMQGITKEDILSVSNEIIGEFQIDGVKIIGDSKKYNRIYIQIPLKYEETLT